MTGGLEAPAAIDRELGATEAIYWLLDKLYCLNFVIFAELGGRLDAKRLHAALAIVQAENPLLRARIASAGGRLWFRPVPAHGAPLRVEMRALRGWRSGIEQQLQQRFEGGMAPLARLLWFKGSGRNSVVAMCFQHCIADGRSGLAVLLDVLRRATVDTSPPHYKAAHASSQALDMIQQRPPLLGALQGLQFWMARGKDALQFAQQLPGYDPTARAQRDVRALPLTIDAELSHQLRRRAREHGTTIQGVLGAALLLALNDQFGTQAPRRLALNSLADLRGVLQGQLSQRDLGLYVSTLCTVHALDAEPDFWALAREIRESLKQQIEAGDANLINGVLPASPAVVSGEGLARVVQSFAALGPPASMLTNLGHVDSVDLGERLRLKSLGAVVSPPAQHPVCVTAISHDGRMALHLLHDTMKVGGKQSSDIGAALLAGLCRAAA